MQNKNYHLRFLPLFILAMLVNILAQTVHETGHHMFYQIMGYEPAWAFTKLVQMSEPPTHPADWTPVINPDGSTNWLKVRSMPEDKTEKAALAAAGPLFGLLSAVLGLIIYHRTARATSQQVWLTYILTISLVAVLYYLRAPMRMGGDEYNIAVNLNIPKSLVETLFMLGYLACLVLGLLELPAWKARLTWLSSILLGSIATGLPMALLDPIIIAQIDVGNVWFQPVFGYSLPVLITILAAFIGVWFWVRWQVRMTK